MRLACVLFVFAASGDGRGDEAAPSPPLNDRPGGAAGARAQRFVDEAAAAARATDGLVAPAWRDVERAVASEFRPPIREVTTQSAPQLLVAQYHAGMTGRTKPTVQGETPYDQPAVWRRSVVDVVVAPDGQLVESRIVGSSGNAALDRRAAVAAEEAVRARSAALHGPARTRVRFSIEAGVSVVPPEAAPTSVPGAAKPSGAIVQISRVHFDETTGNVSKPDYISKKKLHTRVSLIGMEIEK